MNTTLQIYKYEADSVDYVEVRQISLHLAFVTKQDVEHDMTYLGQIYWMNYNTSKSGSTSSTYKRFNLFGKSHIKCKAKTKVLLPVYQNKKLFLFQLLVCVANSFSP